MFAGKFDIRAVVRSGQTLHSTLTGVQDTLPLGNNPVWCTASTEVVARLAMERQNRKTRPDQRNTRMPVGEGDRGVSFRGASTGNHCPITGKRHTVFL